MRQLAWLDYHRGKWHLATSNPRDRIRQWIEKDAALSELAEEEWRITGPYPKESEGERRFCGYALKKVVH